MIGSVGITRSSHRRKTVDLNISWLLPTPPSENLQPTTIKPNVPIPIMLLSLVSP
jgi:hypothetical protein